MKSYSSQKACILTCLLAITITSASADIFQWEWVDPADHSKGKQQSTTLCPNGAGLDPAPGAYLGDRDLTQAYLADMDLNQIYCDMSVLNNADFSGTDLTEATFWVTQLFDADFTGANMRGVNLYGSRLVDANLTGANLTNANLDFTVLAGADLTQLDYRGNKYYPYGAIVRNTVLQDGTVRSLRLGAGDNMRIWDYDGDNDGLPIEIHVVDAFSIDPDATLRMVFEDSHWGSTISFQPGLDVTLAGTLQLGLDLDEGIEPETLFGTTFDLFDWDNANVQGRFDRILVPEDYTFNTDSLYTTGEVTFHPNPEPATIALLALGALSLRRRPATVLSSPKGSSSIT